MSTITKLGSRFTRDTLVFTGATGGTVVLAFATVVVVTRYLPPAEYGELAIFYVFGAFLTVAYSVPLLQGTLIRVFGSAGDEEAAADEGSSAGAAKDGGASKRSELTTGLILTLALALVGTVAIAAFAHPLSRLLVDTDGHRDTVILAASSAAAGALWRLSSNVVRFESRAWKYALLINVRPVLVLACVWLALASGGGVKEAVAGTFVGTILAVALSLAASARNYALTVSRDAVRPLATAGLPYVPVIVSIWIVQNADVFMLSWFAPDDDVGVYRLASRVASVASYAVSALLIAWVPLSRSTLFDAVRQERGPSGLGQVLVMYYAFFSVGLVLVLAVGADALARVAPPAYADAAALIPLLGLAFVFYGFFLVVYRTADFSRKRRRYIGVSMMAAAIFLASALILTPRFGGYGAASAAILAFAAAAGAILIYSQRSLHPLGVEWWRIGAAIAIAAVLYACGAAARRSEVSAAIAVDAAILLLYPVLLVGLRIIRRSHLRSLLVIGRSVLPGSTTRRPVLRRLAGLPMADRAAIRSLLTQQERDERRDRDAVRVLRELAAVGPAHEHDADIASYLVWRGSISGRDEKRRQLREVAVDPLELHELESTLAMLRRLPARTWDGPGGLA